MENVARCTICLEIFEDPRNLECGHTFCKTCINKLNYNTKNDEKDLHCPQCRRPSKYQEEYPKNFEIISIIETLKNKKLTPTFSSSNLSDRALIITNSEETTPKCEDCEVKDSAVFCITCSVFFCDKCHKKTHKTRLFQKHKLLTAKQAQKFALFKCKLHSDEKVEFWCVDCDELLCSICTSSHQFHSTSTLINSLPLIKSKLNDSSLNEYLNIIKQLRKRYSTHHLFYSQVATMIEADQSKLVDIFQKIRNLLDEKEKELIGKIPSFYPDYFDGMQNVNYMKDKFLSYQSFYDHVVQSLQLNQMKKSNQGDEEMDINLFLVKSQIKKDQKEAIELIHSSLPSFSPENSPLLPLSYLQSIQSAIQSLDISIPNHNQNSFTTVIIKDNVNYNNNELQKQTSGLNINNNYNDKSSSDEKTHFKINPIDNAQLRNILSNQSSSSQSIQSMSPLNIKNDYFNMQNVPVANNNISQIYQFPSSEFSKIRFSSEFKGKNVDVTLDCQKAISQSRSDVNFIFSQKIIEGNYVQWKIRIDRLTSRLFLGISSNRIKDSGEQISNSNSFDRNLMNSNSFSSYSNNNNNPIPSSSMSYSSSLSSYSSFSNLGKLSSYNSTSNKSMLDRINAPSNLNLLDVRFRNQTMNDKSNYGITDTKQAVAGELIFHSRPLPSPPFSSGNEILFQLNRGEGSLTIQNQSKAWSYVVKDIPFYLNDNPVDYYFHVILYEVGDQISILDY